MFFQEVALTLIVDKIISINNIQISILENLNLVKIHLKYLVLVEWNGNAGLMCVALKVFNII